MKVDLAKRNRLQGKGNFKLRDWQVECDGLDDRPPAAAKDRRRPKSKVIWDRERQGPEGLTAFD